MFVFSLISKRSRKKPGKKVLVINLGQLTRQTGESFKTRAKLRKIGKEELERMSPAQMRFVTEMDVGEWKKYQKKLKKEMKIWEQIKKETDEERVMARKKEGYIEYFPLKKPSEKVWWKKKKGKFGYIELFNGRVIYSDKLTVSPEGKIAQKKVRDTAALGPFYDARTGKRLSKKDARAVLTLLDEYFFRKHRRFKTLKGTKRKLKVKKKVEKKAEEKEKTQEKEEKQSDKEIDDLIAYWEEGW